MGDVLVTDAGREAPAFDGFSGSPDELITLLQQHQKRYSYLSPQSVREIARFLKVSETHVYSVASFYTQFRFNPPGKHTVRVCLGTACHVQGGEQLSEEIQTILGVRAGETTPDGSFDFQEVACLGCCAQAPVVEIDGKIYGKMTREAVRETLVTNEKL